jgi:hypothetical protein
LIPKILHTAFYISFSEYFVFLLAPIPNCFACSDAKAVVFIFLLLCTVKMQDQRAKLDDNDDDDDDDDDDDETILSLCKNFSLRLLTNVHITQFLFCVKLIAYLVFWKQSTYLSSMNTKRY